MNVLVIEDERPLAKELTYFLHQQSFICETARTAREARHLLADQPFDFVLLDLGLPDGNGLDVLAEARDNHLPAAFIILTARGAVEDRIRGLELGADDYLAKPFSLPELLARMHAITRRRFGLVKPLVTCGAFVLDLQARQLLHTGQEVSLSVKEFDILSYLVLNRNRVLTRLQLTEHVWGHLADSGFDSNFIDAHIKNLRRKLGTHAETDHPVSGMQREHVGLLRGQSPSHSRDRPDPVADQSAVGAGGIHPPSRANGSRHSHGFLFTTNA